MFIYYKFIEKFYNITKALAITLQVEIIDRKEFAKPALNKNIKVFIVYIISFYLE